MAVFYFKQAESRRMKEFIQQLLQHIIFPRINKKKGSIGIVGATAYRASPQQRDDKLRAEPAVLYHDAGLFPLKLSSIYTKMYCVCAGDAKCRINLI